MNNSEASLFLELKRQFPENYIFPNMRLADIIDTMGGSDFIKRRNKVLPRHVDFLICDKNFSPILTIELNGGYHKSIDQQEKDKVKKDIIESVGLPLVVINVGDNFTERVDEIKKTYLR